MVQDRPEFSLYAFIKLRIYQRINQAVRVGRPLTGELLEPLLKGISARRIHFQMTSRRQVANEMTKQFSDFFDMSSYYVRERLRSLNHGTVLRESGRGSRHAVNYEWNEPIDEKILASFQRMQDVLGGSLNFAPDVYRIEQEFGDAAFGMISLVRLFQEHRRRFVQRKWYRLSTSSPRAPRLTQFLGGRIEDLVEAGLVEGALPEGPFRLTARGREAAHWFELFVFSVAYR